MAEICKDSHRLSLSVVAWIETRPSHPVVRHVTDYKRVIETHHGILQVRQYVGYMRYSYVLRSSGLLYYRQFMFHSARLIALNMTLYKTFNAAFIFVHKIQWLFTKSSYEVERLHKATFKTAVPKLF